MFKTVTAAVVATVMGTAAVAHSSPDAHICGVDPTHVGTGPLNTKQGMWYDRGDYFFMFKVEYAHPLDVDGLDVTTHTRLWKDDCRVTHVDIVEGRDKPVEMPVEAPVVVAPPVVKDDSCESSEYPEEN